MIENKTLNFKKEKNKKTQITKLYKKKNIFFKYMKIANFDTNHIFLLTANNKNKKVSLKEKTLQK